MYAFYGETPLIREIQRIPTKSSCYWDAEGERVSPTKSKELTLTGDAPSAELLETASRISAAIPAPFIRIDFLRGPDGAYFGEFTPRPGPYWQFNAEWDAALGEAWLKAEARLQHDLLTGKSFDAFMQSTGYPGAGEGPAYPS